LDDGIEDSESSDIKENRKPVPLKNNTRKYKNTGMIESTRSRRAKERNDSQEGIEVESIHDLSSDDARVEIAKRISKKYHHVWKILKRCHTDRLNNIVTSNNLRGCP